jgi:hypothetical protein
MSTKKGIAERAASPREKQSRTGSSRSSTPVGAAVGFGGSGGALELLFLSLREPYRTWLVVLAPMASVALIAVWPSLLAWGRVSWDRLRKGWKKQRAVKVRKSYVKDQRRLLKKDQTISLQSRKAIEEHIAKVQEAIDRKAFEAVLEHLDL